MRIIICVIFSSYIRLRIVNCYNFFILNEFLWFNNYVLLRFLIIFVRVIMCVFFSCYIEERVVNFNNLVIIKFKRNIDVRKNIL